MKLQNVLLMNRDICPEEALYVRKDGKKLSFDTYFNIFSIAKWRLYTEIASFFLHLEITGRGMVTLYDQNGRIGEYLVEGSTDVTIPQRPDSQCVWFVLRLVEGEFVCGYYGTKQAPAHDVRIALDICTFKREAYLKRNLELLRTQLLENHDSPLYGKLEVFVVDNGRTLDDSIVFDHVHLFPNINAGGSGGFARGLIEINKAKEELGLTHMIFLDDDALMECDAFVRTFGLLSYIREEYQDACISGAMLREDIPYVSHEAGSHWEGTDPWTRFPGLDLRKRENVLLNETIDRPDYAAFWYACYPLHVAGLSNLPLALFLHNDDTEYGLRNPNGFLLLNGICVWCPGFENKRASTLSYYDVRNCMIVNALYAKGGNLGKMKQYCRKRILANTLRYRYYDAFLVATAVKDFLKGPDYLMALDPEEKNTEIIRSGYTPVPVEQLTDDPEILAAIEAYEPPKDVSEIYDNMKAANKWFYALTANGWIFPADGKLTPFVMGIWPYALYRKKEIILFDPDTKKGLRLMKNYPYLLKSLGTYAQILWMLRKDYTRARRAYIERFDELTGYEAWKEYLGLDEQNQ